MVVVDGLGCNSCDGFDCVGVGGGLSVLVVGGVVFS